MLQFERKPNLGPGNCLLIVDLEPFLTGQDERLGGPTGDLGTDRAGEEGMMQRDLGDVVAARRRAPESDGRRHVGDRGF